MAAAAFQNAARTLGGRAIQRTQAAGLLPRLMPGGSPATASSSRLFGSSSSSSGVPNRYKHMDDDASRVLMQLERMKEELYDLLRKVMADPKYRHPFSFARNQNLKLRQQLSVHVDVRPDDPVWCSDRRSYVTSMCIWVAAIWHNGYTLGKGQRDHEEDNKSTSCPTEKQID